MTAIQSLLKQAQERLSFSSDSAALDAEVLLCEVLNKTRSYLRAWPEKSLSDDDTARYWQLIKDRQHGKPIAYITGRKEFWSRDFMVTSDVLIPRPDTEILIEKALALIPADQPAKILDLGTGSGVIAITLAAERPLATIVATDFSTTALTCAQANSSSHKISNLSFIQSDWFTSLPEGKFDLIISNPPYISDDDSHLNQGDLRFEPKSALRAADNGLSDIKIIVQDARQYLHAGGHLLIEHGYNQKQLVQNIFTGFEYQNIDTYLDYSGQARVTHGRWHSQSLNKPIELLP